MPVVDGGLRFKGPMAEENVDVVLCSTLICEERGTMLLLRATFFAFCEDD